MNTGTLKPRLAALALVFGLAPFAAVADSGFYVGGGLGGATLEADDLDFIGLTSLDEDDTAYKLFAGYNFDLPVVNLGVELGYVDFGKPEIDTNFGQIELDPTGVNLWGIAGVDAGPIDLFAKLGYITWDVEATGLGTSDSDDGSDMGYGVGLGFGLGGIKIRGEYEMYDIEDADLSMLSLSILYQFD